MRDKHPTQANGHTTTTARAVNGQAEPADQADGSLPVPVLLLAPRDAAAALAISERTLWDLTAQGEILVVRVGRCVRYSVATLREWIRAKEQAGRPEAE